MTEGQFKHYIAYAAGIHGVKLGHRSLYTAQTNPRHLFFLDGEVCFGVEEERTVAISDRGMDAIFAFEEHVGISISEIIGIEIILEDD